MDSVFVFTQLPSLVIPSCPPVSVVGLSMCVYVCACLRAHILLHQYPILEF